MFLVVFLCVFVFFVSVFVLFAVSCVVFFGGRSCCFWVFLLGFFIGIVFPVVVAKSAYIDERDAGQ